VRLLVIDTALGLCTAGVFENERALAVRSEPMAKGHQERAPGLVRDVVAATGGFERLERVGVTVGPGSFTGLRVGLAFALGVGAARDLTVVGVTTLDALAASTDAPKVAALIDARRGQVYARFFQDGLPLGPAEALGLEEARTRLSALGSGVRLVGSGAALFAETAPPERLHPLEGPAADAIARLAAAAEPSLSLARPLYLRAPDATPPSRLPGQPRPGRA